MGILNAIMGNASDIDPEVIKREYADLLCDGEQIEQAFSIIRDKWVFTDRRLIIQNTQGVTGRKREYHSIPYRSIEHFSVETSGTFDIDCEMKIWVRGLEEPLEQNFGKSIDIKQLQKMLARHLL